MPVVAHTHALGVASGAALAVVEYPIHVRVVLGGNYGGVCAIPVRAQLAVAVVQLGRGQRRLPSCGLPG